MKRGGESGSAPTPELFVAQAMQVTTLPQNILRDAVTAVIGTANPKGELKDVETELRALLLPALAGDNAAYAAFLRRTSAHLRAFFRRRLIAYPDDMEDLVQETLLALHNQRHTWLPSQRLTPWLYAIARYKLVDLLRVRLPRRAVEIALDDVDEEALADRDDGALDARRDLVGLLMLLPERHRLPIQRVKIEGLSIAEAAVALGMSESAVKVGIHRGLRKLAAVVAERR